MPRLCSPSRAACLVLATAVFLLGLLLLLSADEGGTLGSDLVRHRGGHHTRLESHDHGSKLGLDEPPRNQTKARSDNQLKGESLHDADLQLKKDVLSIKESFRQLQANISALNSMLQQLDQQKQAHTLKAANHVTGGGKSQKQQTGGEIEHQAQHTQTEDYTPDDDDGSEADISAVYEYVDRILAGVKPRPVELPTCPERREHREEGLLYVKIHKCASETLSAVLRRYAYDRNLSVVLPLGKKFNLGWPYRLEPWMYRPPKHGSGGFHVLADHAVYDASALAGLMVPGARHVTALREPFSHLQSAFYFFNVFKLGHVTEDVPPGGDALTTFLRRPEHYDAKFRDPLTWPTRPCVPPYLSVTRNLMAFDLGLPNGFDIQFRFSNLSGSARDARVRAVMAAPDFPYRSQEDNVTHVTRWLQDLDSRLSLVLIVDYFHESLVMLKRTMCWSHKDIIYRTRNKTPSQKKPAAAGFPPRLVARYLRWSLADTLLYRHYNNTFWRRVDAMGRRDFSEEVAHFTTVLSRVTDYCDHVTSRRDRDEGAVHVPASRWDDAFTFTPDDCLHIASKNGLRDELKRRYDSDPTPVKMPKWAGAHSWSC